MSVVIKSTPRCPIYAVGYIDSKYLNELSFLYMIIIVRIDEDDISPGVLCIRTNFIS